MFRSQTRIQQIFSVFLAVALSAFFSSCAKEKTIEEKEKCFSDKVLPLVARTGKKVPWPEAKFDEGVLIRFADDCEFSDEERSAFFLDHRVQFAPKGQAIPNPTKTPSPNPTVTVTPFPTPSPSPSKSPSPGPSVTVTPVPSPTPSVTVTPVPSPSPTPTKPVVIPPHGSLSPKPITDLATITAAVADDGVCRIRYFGPAAGSQAGYNILSGRRVVSTTPAKDLASGIVLFTSAATKGDCMKGAAEKCQLRYRTHQLAGTQQGFYVAIEGHDLTETGATSPKLSLDVYRPLEKAGICSIENPLPTCTVEAQQPPATGFVVVSSVQGWMQDLPLASRTTADFYLQALQDNFYCAR